jgi:G3E family GTPase
VSVADYDALIPVSLITGFLGSGKTTLLNRLLRAPELANTAVVVNEFGDVGLDHLLIETVDGATVILESGCVCCTIRGDLADALRALLGKRERGLVPRFERIALETTGLADPAPIVATLIAEPVLRHHVRLGSVIATVDAVNGLQHLADNPESVKQVAVADRLVVTKTDLAEPTQVAALEAALARLNPTAPVIDAVRDPLRPDELIANDVYDPERKSAEVRRWLGAAVPRDDERYRPAASRHDRGIRAFCLTFEEPLDWTVFGIWLTMLLHAHGTRVLRVKGLLNVRDLAAPVVIHGVQHVIHPPIHLERWPDDDRRSRIVFIVRDLEPGAIERSLAAFNRQADRAAVAA